MRAPTTLQTNLRLSPLALLLTLALTVAACAPPGSSAPSQAGPAAARAEKQMTLAVENEPHTIAAGFGDPSADKASLNLRMALSQRLATYDDRGGLRPMLAAELPSRDTGTWVLRPDGTMQTTYRLRPGVTWHDGTPFSSDDVVFGWTLMVDPTVGQSIPPTARLISSVAAPDALTVVIDWASTYPFAHALVGDEVGPLPRHVLGGIFESDRARVLEQPYFREEFLGLGPYRLAKWELGNNLLLKAYDSFYAGRAKIDTIVVRFIPNPPTAVSNILAGTIDGALPRTLDFAQAMDLKHQWELAGKHPVILTQPTHWRHVYVQFRPEFAVPRELLDPRVRQALMYALDRQALAQALFEGGAAPVADAFIPPDDVKWDWVKETIAHYDLDPRRAEQLFSEIGWRRGSNGLLAGADGKPVVMGLWTTPGAQYAEEAAILGDSWKTAGLTIEQAVLTPTQNADKKYVASFPSLNPSQIPIGQDTLLGRIYGPNCAADENRWNGSNRSCYQNAAVDRVDERLQKSIDPAEQRQLYGDLARLLTNDLGLLPLYFSVQAMVFREGVTGVKGDTRPSTSETWNIAEWDLTTN